MKKSLRHTTSTNVSCFASSWFSSSQSRNARLHMTEIKQRRIERQDHRLWLSSAAVCRCLMRSCSDNATDVHKSKQRAWTMTATNLEAQALPAQPEHNTRLQNEHKNKSTCSCRLLSAADCSLSFSRSMVTATTTQNNVKLAPRVRCVRIETQTANDAQPRGLQSNTTEHVLADHENQPQQATSITVQTHKRIRCSSS